MAEEHTDFEQLSKDMEKEIEKLHIRIAKGFAGGTHVPGFFATFQKKWQSLSYMEKVYTISMIAIAGSVLLANLVDIFRHEISK